MEGPRPGEALPGLEERPGGGAVVVASFFSSDRNGGGGRGGSRAVRERPGRREGEREGGPGRAGGAAGGSPRPSVVPRCERPEGPSALCFKFQVRPRPLSPRRVFYRSLSSS